ncbi:MAG: HNH endonuclease, partial [Actinomycetia bacterium]|nr:HNH endonuclease [Actinomycetes bacterium]
SVALTMLADPDQVADLHDLVQQLRQRCATETPADDPATGDTANDAAAGDDPASSADGGESGDGGDPRPRRCPNCGGREAFQRPARLPATALYVHLDAATGTWSLDGHGPITHGEATDLVGHSHVTVKPVIDLASNITYTGYVAPPRLKEQTALANQGFCTFPNCGNSAWRGEYDHIVDYHARGPTDARNGHRLCKHHHRAKTFTDWTVISPAQGVWLWRSPRSRFYLVTEGTTTPLELGLFRYAA